MGTTIIATSGPPEPDNVQEDDLGLTQADWAAWLEDIDDMLRLTAVARGWECPDRL